MITVYCINIYGQRFEKEFDDYWKARVFILRCMHGNRVDVLGFNTEDRYCNEELGRLLNYGY